MIKINTTAKLTGINISGQLDDFDELYESLNKIISRFDVNKDGSPKETKEGNRLLGLSYDIRHCIMYAHSQAENEEDAPPLEATVSARIIQYPKAASNDNTLNKEIASGVSPPPDGFATSKEEASFNILWPEALYQVFLISHYLGGYFLLGYSKDRKHLDWSPEWAFLRLYQTKVLDCFYKTIPTNRGKTIAKTIMEDSWSISIIPQYVDSLNSKYLMTKLEKRPGVLAQLPRKLLSLNSDCVELERSLKTAALERGCDIAELALELPWPEEIEW